MIKQTAKIIAETDTSYLLETLPQSSCARCEAGEGCGAGFLVKAFANRTYQLSISKTQLASNNKSLQVNSLVQIGIQSSILVRASLVLYLLPLLAMVSGALIAGSLVNNQDLYTVIGATIGLISGLSAAKILSERNLKAAASPVLIDEDEDDCWYQAD